MSPELVGIITLFGTIVALGAALFGTLKQFANYLDKRFDQMNKRFDQIDKHFDQIDKHFDQIDKHFDRIEGDISKLVGMGWRVWRGCSKGRSSGFRARVLAIPREAPRQSLPRAACRRSQ